MTTRSNDVAVTITGKDRLSPVIQNVRKNMGRMQSSVVSMTSSLGAMSTATSGVLGPMIGLVGGMGALGLVVTGVGLGLSIGINKFKAWREEQKKVSQATENLRNRLMLSGFSAAAATSSVDELRSSIGRLAFQALPGLDFEMQGFIANLDRATKTRFGDLVQTLIDLGVEPVAANKAIAEALQDNFTLINKLVPESVTNVEEFSGAMGSLADKSAIAGSKVLQILRDMGSGTAPLEDGIEQLLQASNRLAATGDFEQFRKTFEVNGALIQRLLGNLTQAEFQFVVDQLDGFKTSGRSAAAYSGRRKTAIDEIIADLKRGREEETNQTAALRGEIDARIAEIRRTDPAMAEEFQKVADRNAEDPWALAELKKQLLVFIQEVTAEASGLVGFLDSAAARARNRLASIRSGAATARAATVLRSTVVPRVATRRRIDGIPPDDPAVGTVGSIQHGAIVRRPMIARVGEVPEVIAPLSRLPSLLEGMGGPRTIHIPVYIGDRLVRDIVIDVLNDEVSLREPSLGLG